MKSRKISIAVIALASGLLLSSSHIQGVHADDRHERACSNKTLKGSYGFYRTGNTSEGPLAAVGLISFDGNGNQTGAQNVSRNGVFNFDRPIGGEYEVAEDCTAKFIDPTTGNEIARVVIVDNGKELYSLSLMAGNAIYGVYRKIDNRPEHGHDR